MLGAGKKKEEEEERGFGLLLHLKLCTIILLRYDFADIAFDRM